MIWLAFGLGIVTGMVIGIFLVGLLQTSARSARRGEILDPFPCRLES